MKERDRLYWECKEVEQCCTRGIRDAIRKHLPRLAMLHSEVEKAVFPLSHDINGMVRTEVDRRDRLDSEKLKVMEEQIKTRKRKRERNLEFPSDDESDDESSECMYDYKPTTTVISTTRTKNDDDKSGRSNMRQSSILTYLLQKNNDKPDENKLDQ